ncbi:MAG: endopeptidase La [Paludibacteraceae bacterium]|nr:endopeptidase La [Paludibacteraceae bacterium]
MLLEGVADSQTEFIPVVADEDDVLMVESKDGDELPLIPLRNMVLFPGVVLPVSVGRAKTLRLIRSAYNNNEEICVATQKDAKKEDPELDDLYTTGTIAKIIRILEMPDNTTTVILQGKKRADVLELTKTTPFLHARVQMREEIVPATNNEIFQALVEAIKDVAVKIIKLGVVPSEATFAVRNIEPPRILMNFICTNFDLKVDDKVRLLLFDDLEKRGNLLLDLLTKELQLLEIKVNIQSKARSGIDQQQREFFLQQQMKTIQDELGGVDEEQELDEFRERAKSKKWDEKTKKVFEKELRRLERTNPHSPDYSVQLNYVETILNLPWNEYTEDNFDLKRAQRILDKDHYGLDDVKERILEHLAILKLQKNFKSPIICLYGPPGVGKTSLGKSIAEALNRKYARISLGGMQDEAEIRGHRRTYIGALPGRIIQNVQKVGTSNPVFVLDEIDKVNRDFKGDPSAALLEVLDPEQNVAFHDNYLDLDYDLSKVLFVATANSLSGISKPLLDRMELIEVSGYVAEEKVEIAQKHLIPKQMEAHGLNKKDLVFSKSVVRDLIESYTRESGVRELDRVIAKVIRKIAKKVAMEESYKPTLTIKDVRELLGVPRYSRDKYQGNDYVGVVTGLAWTSVGGEILFVEASLSKGKEKRLTLTGNLGDVMKESAILALEYIKSHTAELGVSQKELDSYNIHVHVPEGSIPKDGPSAGITIVTALVSALKKCRVRKGFAMTGEITLRGKVLPVGGIREKILAAKRSGITEIILCEDNKKDIDEINQDYIKGLVFHYVKDIKDVIQIALEE